MNEYEKAFVQRMGVLKVTPGPGFASLVQNAFEREMGGEETSFLTGISRKTLEDPEKFAAELYNTYGTEAMGYLSMIVRFAESGDYHPSEDAEERKEEEELESIIEETGSDPDRPEETD